MKHQKMHAVDFEDAIGYDDETESDSNHSAIYADKYSQLVSGKDCNTNGDHINGYTLSPTSSVSESESPEILSCDRINFFKKLPKRNTSVLTKESKSSYFVNDGSECPSSPLTASKTKTCNKSTESHVKRTVLVRKKDASLRSARKSARRDKEHGDGSVRKKSGEMTARKVNKRKKSRLKCLPFSKVVVNGTSSLGRVSQSILSEETGLFVPPLKLSKLSRDGELVKFPPVESLPGVSSSGASSPRVPATSSLLLSMIGQMVNTPKYTSIRSPSLSPSVSDFPDCPIRSSWPILREMISTPSVTTVSVSPATRQTLSTVHVEPPPNDEPAPNVASKLEKEIKCFCKFNKGESCWQYFSEERIRKERLHHLKMKRESLDLVILAKIAANINREEKTRKSRGRERQRCRLCYYHEGRKICRETFLFIHGICKGRLCALMKHYKNQGLSVRVHGNKSNVPHHALSNDDSDRVLDFIRDYANDHCISSFGRKPGSKAGGGLLIMSPSQSKLYVHHKYKLSCSHNGTRAVSLRSFQNLWAKHLPYIIVLRGSNKTPVPESGSDETFTEPNENSLTTSCDILNTTSSDTTATSHSKEGAGGDTVPTSVSTDSHQVPGDDDEAFPMSCTRSYPILRQEVGGQVKGRKKRKTLPTRKLETPASLPTLPDQDFVHNQMFDNSTASIHPVCNNISNCANNNDMNIMNSNCVTIVDSLKSSVLSQPTNVHHSSMFNDNVHISTTSPTSLQHVTTTIGRHNGDTTTMLATNKGMLSTYNKSPVQILKEPDLRPAMYIPQSSQLLETYSIHCTNRFAPSMSTSHSLSDQSHNMLFQHQGTDFANVHPIDWQAWPSYNL